MLEIQDMLKAVSDMKDEPPFADILEQLRVLVRLDERALELATKYSKERQTEEYWAELERKEKDFKSNHKDYLLRAFIKELRGHLAYEPGDTLNIPQDYWIGVKIWENDFDYECTIRFSECGFDSSGFTTIGEVFMFGDIWHRDYFNDIAQKISKKCVGRNVDGLIDS